MNQRDTFITNLNQAIAAYDAKCAECEVRDRRIAELLTQLDLAEREIQFHRGELDEDLSYELGDGHELSSPRDEFDELGREVTRRNCNFCGAEETRFRDTGSLIGVDGELELDCQGHTVVGD